jgi:tetratricopeptide (TPR) repeat protein
MTGLGVLGDVRPADWFDRDAVPPARPGSESLSTLVTSKRHPSSSDQGESIEQAAKVARDGARRAATSNPTSTTMAALAQSHAALDEREEAIEAARRAVELAFVSGGHEGSALVDPVSLRLAAEVLLRFGETGDAYDALLRAPRTRSLRVMFATVAFQEGQVNLALEEIEDLSHPLAEAVKGYILATIGEYQKAIGHLRAALRDQPDDPDSLLNLSISLWHLGAKRKAIATALRATRVAPGRKDVSLHYMNLLLDRGEIAAVDAEIRSLKAHDVIEGADLLVVQARALIEKGQLDKAISILRLAADAAEREGDDATRGEVLGNLVVLRFNTRRITYEGAVQRLEELLEEFTACDSLVVAYAGFARTAGQARLLRSVVDRVSTTTSPLRLAYLRYQIAFLEGDNEAAAAAASDWFAHEPDNSMAAAAAIVALGIGVEQWKAASIVAREALARFPSDETIVNNAAYVLAMAGHAQEAIELLRPIAGDAFVMNATLGLAHLAAGSIDEGMRLYRQAADSAEKIDPIWRSLMTSYQALVVRQLGLLDSQPGSVIGALALAQFDPPADWRNRPDFLRLWGVAKRHGYGWPLAL